MSLIGRERLIRGAIGELLATGNQKEQNILIQYLANLQGRPIVVASEEDARLVKPELPAEQDDVGIGERMSFSLVALGCLASC